MTLPLTPSTPPGQLVVAHDAPLTRASWAKHGTRAVYLSPAVNHYRCHNVFLPLSNPYRVCQTLDHFPDPLFSFEDTYAPLPQKPTFIDYNILDLEIPDPPSPNPNPNSNPNPRTNSITFFAFIPPVSQTVSPGTAGVHPRYLPPDRPEPSTLPHSTGRPHTHRRTNPVTRSAPPLRRPRTRSSRTPRTQRPPRPLLFQTPMYVGRGTRGLR